MHDDLWHKLMWKVALGDYTPVPSRWSYDEIVEWCRGSFQHADRQPRSDDILTRIRRDSLKSFVVEYEGEQMRVEYDGSFFGPMPLGFCIEFRQQMRAQPKTLTFFKDQKVAMQFKLAQE